MSSEFQKSYILQKGRIIIRFSRATRVLSADYSVASCLSVRHTLVGHCRWVHAARGLASTALSFHSCNILRDSRRGVSRRQKCGLRYVKTSIFLTVVNYTIFAAIIDSFMSN